jgi:hypothetical protein
MMTHPSSWAVAFLPRNKFNDKSKKHVPLIEANHQQCCSSKKQRKPQHKQQHTLLPLLP